MQKASEVASLPKSRFNMRMAAEEVSQKLTGFGHNAVTPICSKTQIPMIMSHRIAELSDIFFLGAGEVDLKVGVSPKEFIEAYKDEPLWVVDCTTG
jgi:prolyl-tRNA editing enzyme YbaK/EbsC (Cys-tRNA(Pro) deacylase)